MKILALHSDYITYESKKKAIDSAEEVPSNKTKQHIEECLVVFSCVEKCDEENEEEVAKKLFMEIKDIAIKVNTNRIVLYPYAHLSSKLAKPSTAIAVLNKTKELLDKDFEVNKAPFGWYKAFEIKCKGHPLSELSREFCIEKAQETSKSEEVESKAIAEEEKITKTLWVLTPEGRLIAAEDFDFSNHESLKKLYNYEIAGSRLHTREPPHIALMRRHELVDYEPGSDPGNFRWYPKGCLMKKLMEEHVSNILIKNGAMQVETPIMYDLEHPALSKYLHRFPARQYIVLSDDKKYFLRFAACFGQYLMKHDMQISYKNLPLKLYELTHYSFRREQRGELAGIKRLRAFTMPDMHTLTKDMEMTKDEFINQYKLSMEYMQSLNMEYDCIARFQEDFYKENEDFARELAKLIGKPMLIELFDKRYAYFVMKFEFSVNDALDKAATLSTVQIDVENTERFDITYTDKDGSKKHPLMMHASISGSIDRDLYALLEVQAIKAEKGEIPEFPLWLSPTQVRIVPVSSERHTNKALDILKELEESNIRVDIDDNDDSVSKKIMRANKEWVPYIIVLGDKEIESGKLTVRVRHTNSQATMTASELIEEIKLKTSGKPFRPLSLPKLLSKRPVFFGGSGS